ncbi:MAG: class I SAM-dependent methyltransferase [Bacteroidetes bacterium]|nr:class I SAM-dependent methyltransferase [Bacteroidota bacterium]
MKNTTTLINDVSDTALWVAYYRAKESRKPNALFKDPLAELVMGERGRQIAEDMKNNSRFSEWTVIMRTVIIDNFIVQMIAEGIDTVLNLGAGLDTRPYRMQLPSSLKWIEADYPNIIDQKNKVLQSHRPCCHLVREKVDLANDVERTHFLNKIASESKNILVLTEGVVVYLSEKQTSALAADLRKSPSFKYWIVEYISPHVYPHLQTKGRKAKMQNAPFRFFPKDWLAFFKSNGFEPKETRYFGEEGVKFGRSMPLPRIALLFRFLAPKATFERTKKMSGFILLKRSD